MITYRTREGVLLTKICDVYLLVADLHARNHCPYVTPINETGAFIWKLIEKGSCTDCLVSRLLEEYDLSEKDAITAVNSFLKQLIDAGYVMEEKESDAE